MTIEIFPNITIPENKSILVLSSYRTGSTALCDLLSKKTKLLNLDEFFHTNSLGDYSKYQYNNTIIKCMPDQVDTKYWDLIVRNFFIIGITRKSVVSQIASFYISHVTKKWHYTKVNNLVLPYEVRIDKLDLEDQIRYILKMNELYNLQFASLVDLELVYEDIFEILNESKYIIFTKPTNYNQLIETINTLMMDILK